MVAATAANCFVVGTATAAVVSALAAVVDAAFGICGFAAPKLFPSFSTYLYSCLNSSWYFGKIKRIEAEKKLLLPQNEHGTFLIRDSESRKNDYSLSVKDGDTVKHYRIRQLDEGGFFIARRTTFRTLQELVEHYSRDADGLCVNLKGPCIQVQNSLNVFS